MAEIHVERKPRTSPLIWLVLLVVLGVIAWFLWTTYGGPAEAPAAPATVTEAGPDAPPRAAPGVAALAAI
ncbi:MAG TPA: hypothetical protein VMS56_15285 [Thermoanaerobaculia bacterium]|nr:hypothetical protein [Thermoanaerobaculia bacterium]